MLIAGYSIEAYEQEATVHKSGKKHAIRFSRKKEKNAGGVSGSPARWHHIMETYGLPP